MPNPNQEPNHSCFVFWRYVLYGWQEKHRSVSDCHDLREVNIIYSELNSEAVSLLAKYSKRFPVFTKKEI